jgi:DNA-binding CsgD family transcriptional regulator
MNLSHYLRKWRQPARAGRQFDLNTELMVSLEALAERRNTTPNAIMSELVQNALLMEQVERETWQNWQSLTPREKEVTALVCQGYSNAAICAHLGIANETVRTHVRNLLGKFEVANRNELRVLLAKWDFSAWN